MLSLSPLLWMLLIGASIAQNQTCPFCPDGSPVGKPDLNISFLSSPLGRMHSIETCKDVEDLNLDCDLDPRQMFSLRYVCRCPGIEPVVESCSGVCKDPTSTLDENSNFDIGIWGEVWTVGCQMMDDYASQFDASDCSGGFAPTESFYVNEKCGCNVDDWGPVCELCGLGVARNPRSDANLERQCQYFNSQGRYAKLTECDDFFKRWYEDEGVAAVCGCPDAMPRTDTYSCTLCEDGNPPSNPDAILFSNIGLPSYLDRGGDPHTLSDLSCGALDTFLPLFADGSLCPRMQSFAALGCGCNSVGEGSETARCPDGSSIPDRSASVSKELAAALAASVSDPFTRVSPILSSDLEVTCGEVVHFANSPEGEANTLVQNTIVPIVCGCPGVLPNFSICGEDDIPEPFRWSGSIEEEYWSCAKVNFQFAFANETYGDALKLSFGPTCCQRNASVTSPAVSSSGPIFVRAILFTVLLLPSFITMCTTM